jgi:diguanylate cyclase (GGDEF)-like protein
MAQGHSVVLDEAALAASQLLLAALPYPVLLISEDYRVTWSNPAAKAVYGEGEGACHLLSHSHAYPCALFGEACPKARAEAEGAAVSVSHAHNTATGLELFNVTVLPVSGGGVLEFHIPLDDVMARDQLTGLYSRDFFEQLVLRQRPLLERLGVGYALVMLDLDEFKKINDLHGHAAGNAALGAVGVAIRAAIRSADSAGRLGGDEIAIFLPAAGLAGAVTQAHRVHTAVREVRLPEPWDGIRVRASLGVVAVSAQVGYEVALAAADRAMYRAKDAGRDRVQVAEEPDLAPKP